jgi:cyclophilin family peptidyl-prolyl cis-trans isomerase
MLKYHCRGVWVGLIVGVGVIGCGKSEPSQPAAATGTPPAAHELAPSAPASSAQAKLATPATSATSATPATQPSPSSSATTPATPTASAQAGSAQAGREPATAAVPAAGPSLFDCVITDIDPDSKLQIPPETTIAGKSTADLLTAVEAEWAKVTLTGKNGEPAKYTVQFDTRLGPVVIALDAQLAPMHVRNFVALARAGYYDGLCFERIVRQQSSAASNNKLLLVEAGCPFGTGDHPEQSHLGYWLKPEISEKSKHVPGSVGMCLVDGNPDTGACRFYVALEPHANMDGVFSVFGRVTKGLEHLFHLASQPIRDGESYENGAKPVEPLRIERVTVTCE